MWQLFCTMASMLHLSRDTENGCLLACTLPPKGIPLTTPPSASTAAPPPPSHTIVDIDACRTQCGGCAVCWEGLPCRKGGGRSDRRQ